MVVNLKFRDRALNIKRIFAKTVWTRILAGIAAIWILGCCVIYSMMRKPPETFARFMAKVPGPVAFLAFPFETMWTRARAGELHVGDAAPDFSLKTLDKSAVVQLPGLTMQGRPVVLIFGSYT
jgi:hypothetical protein